MKRLIYFLFLLPAIAQSQTMRPTRDGWNENRIDITKGTGTFYVPCMIRFPAGYHNPVNAATKYPVIVYGHGSGQGGTDTLKAIQDGWARNLSDNGATTYVNESALSWNGSSATLTLGS